MRKLVEFQILDKNAEHYGVSISELMQNAGNELSKYIMENYSTEAVITIVCGKGNNGGDGFVCAFNLIDVGFKVNILIAEPPSSKISIPYYKKLENRLTEISFLSKFKDETGLLVDCLLGSGITGNPRQPYDEYIEEINNFENILSVDVPSGFLSQCSVKPGITITFHDLKEGMNEENCGEIVIRDVGIPEEIELKTGPGELLLYPKWNPKKHKGQNGKVAVVGGGPFKGAPALAGLGAYRGGADLVHVFVPESSYQSVSGFIPELIVHSCAGDLIDSNCVDQIKSLNIEFDSYVIGPGIGKNSLTKGAIQLMIDTFENIVLDADAIEDYNFSDNILVTPHAGEIGRLVSDKSEDSMVNFAKENSLTILMKGEQDIITDGNQIKYNSTGHARMAVGGTGDVLAGLCGALLAKGLTPFESGRLAAYSIGLAGESAYQEFGSGFLPTDLALSLSKILEG